MELQLLFTIITLLNVDSETVPACCPNKIVGGVAYQLVEENPNTSMFGCIDSCVYTKLGEGDKFCFTEGTGSVQCFDDVTACTDSSDCPKGQECDQMSNSCMKGTKKPRQTSLE